MIETRDNFRFALEPLFKVRVAGDTSVQNLHRNCALQPRISRLIDLAHSTGPGGSVYPIRSELCACFKCH